MPNTPLTYVNIGQHGRFHPTGTGNTTSADIDAIFADIVRSGRRKVALHFHGGLVGRDQGMARAESMRAVYEQAQCHPVTFVWETGFLETLEANLSAINDTELYRKILFWVVKKAGKHLDLDIAAKGAGAEFTDVEIEAELQREAPFEQLGVGAAARGGAGPLSTASLATKRLEIQAELDEDMESDPAFRALLAAPPPGWDSVAADKLAPAEQDGGKGFFDLGTAVTAVAEVAVRVLARFLARRDHGFFPTVVEEILRELYLDNVGAWVWEGMKDAAEAMWLPNTGLADDQRHAGRYFLEGLAALQKNSGITVDLIGHSAGAIAICHMLKRAAADGVALNVRNILWLAPAARIELFHDEIVSKPQRYQAFRMFTMEDKQEVQDRLVGSVYSRSLLYFISGVLEHGNDVLLAGLARQLFDNDTYRDAPIAAIRSFLVGPQLTRLVLARSSILNAGAGLGLRSDAHAHGGFDQEPMTQQSLIHILSQN